MRMDHPGLCTYVRTCYSRSTVLTKFYCTLFNFLSVLVLSNLHDFIISSKLCIHMHTHVHA